MANKILAWAIVIIGIVVLGIVLFGGKFSSTGNVVATGAETISIPLSEVTEQATFYEQEIDGVKVKFFAVRASDGSIKTAFDACDVCFSEKKGYRQEGNYMVCNNCGNKYPISSLGTENLRGGGCWPGYLPSEVQGENIIIQRKHLVEGKQRFT